MNIVKRVSATLGRLTGRTALPHLEFEPLPHYFYLVSFPKSGNTWVRFLLANLLAPGELTLRQFGRYVPDSHIKGDLVYMRDSNSPFSQARRQFVKTHSRYRPEFQQVIYIVRDGRDAITSYYHWVNARRDTPLSLTDIISGKTSVGLWSDHVQGWLNGACRQRFVLKYEDLYAHTARGLQQILDAVELEATPEQIAHAVEASSFEHMRQLEQDLRKQEGQVEPQKPEKILFVRKGGSGDWRNLFSAEDEELFWKYHRAGMRVAGYPTE